MINQNQREWFFESTFVCKRLDDTVPVAKSTDQLIDFGRVGMDDRENALKSCVGLWS